MEKIVAKCFQHVQRLVLAKNYFGVRGTLKCTVFEILSWSSAEHFDKYLIKMNGNHYNGYK